jgi:hypothetical protein
MSRISIMLSRAFKSKLWISLILLIGCSEPSFKRDQKLHQIVQEDLKFIVAEILSATGDTYLLEKPYYQVSDYRIYQGDTARTIEALAIVHFHYISEDRVFEERRYRYQSKGKYWDRYYKKMRFNSDLSFKE